MNRTKVLQEIRLMRFNEVYDWWTEGRITQEEASFQLGMSERTFRRYCRRHEADDIQGLFDKRLEKHAHNAAPVDEVIALLELFESKYSQFNVAHFFEMYSNRHYGTRSYTWVKNQLQDHGIVKKAKRKGVHRRKRERAAMAGMLIHQDGSRHEWVEGKYWDLIVTMDDATGEVYSGFFVEEEGTNSSFKGVSEVILSRGLFCSFYSDRGSHYWNTPTAGGKVDKNNLTQFGRAMKQLGIEMIPAYSPEARGRSERLFGTVQNRIPQELALAKIQTIEEANDYLKREYWVQHNKRFTVEARDENSAFVPWLNSSMNLHDILCTQEQRTVGNDNTVSYKNKTLQIPRQQERCNYFKAKVRVHEYEDGTLAVFHGPRKLAEYDLKGNIILKTKEKKTAMVA